MTNVSPQSTQADAEAATPPATATSLPRLWPAAVILAMQIGTIGVSITPSINDSVRFGYMMLGPASCVLLFIIWLLGFSRLVWRERLTTLAAAVALAAISGFLVDPSMGVAMWIYGAPLTLLAISVGLWVRRRGSARARFALLFSLLLLVWGAFPLGRLEGFNGNYWPEIAWRWSPTSEALLARKQPEVAPQAASTSWSPVTIEWPGFRGPTANGQTADSRADLPWTDTPNVLWRVPVGPGWSSFAHVSGRLFTQEQRDEEEAVTCLDSATGAVIWRTSYPCRFSDVVSGAGPRATPTYREGRLYTYGGRAILSCLNAADGKILWKRDLMAEVNAPLPVWGFTSSPLLIADCAIVYAGGDGDNGLIAFHQLTGEPIWRYHSKGMNFSSPERIEVAGKELILFGEESGLVALEPASGAVVWKYMPADWNGPAICQPQQITPDSLLVPLGDGQGLARLQVTHDGDAWNVKERWSTDNLKPSFNDFVYHDGYCYGFDNHVFACVDAETGALKWEHNGYGFGQVILLADVAKLVITTEKGDAALVAADPAEHRELGRWNLIQGKTWNHPIAAAGRLFVRNGQEAVAVALSSAVQKTT